MIRPELLVLIVPVTRRNEVVDLFMEMEGVSGFTRSPAAGFSREHSHFSLREAVQGFEDQERFEILLDAERVDALLQELTAISGRDRFFFWTSPVARQGRLQGDEPSPP